MRITYLGEEIYSKPKRNSRGRFHRPSRMFWVAMALSGVVLVAHPFVISALDDSMTYDKVSKTLIIDKTPAKIEALKNEVVATIAKCESAGIPEEDGIVILDTNGVGSYGVMQWQRKSVMYYYEKRTGEKINGRDAILLAMDAEKAKDLAKWTIFSNNNGEDNWYNCSKKNNISGLVKAIKYIQ